MRPACPIGKPSSAEEYSRGIAARDPNGKLRLFTSQGNIFPGGNFVPYFVAPFEPLGNSTPGNAVLKGEVRKVVGPKVDLPRTVNFDDDTVLLLDRRQAVFTPTELVRLAEILKLDTSPQSAQQGETQEGTVAGWQEVYGAE